MTKVTILQGAHGSMGGGASCNGSENTGDEILDIIESISTKSQVGVLLDSCFSGDIIAKKLKRESSNKSLSSIKNSCVITSSTMNKVSYAYDEGLIAQALKQTTEISLNDFFANSFKNGGLISSAQWLTIYLDLYLENEAALSMVDAISGVDKINNFANSSNIMACITEQQIDPIFSGPTQSTIFDFCSEGQTNCSKIIDAIVALSKNYVVTNFWDGFISTDQKERSGVELEYFEKCKATYKNFDSKDTISFCKDLEASKEEFKNWFQENTERKKKWDCCYWSNTVERCLYEFFPDFLNKDKYFYYDWKKQISKCSNSSELENQLNLLAAVVPKNELTEILSSKVTSEEKALKILRLYNSANPSKNKNNDLYGQALLLSILGKGFELPEVLDRQDNHIASSTSAHILESWVRYNLGHPIRPSDIRDDQRKKACDDFQIKVTPN